MQANFVAKVVEILQRLDRRFWPAHRLELSPQLEALLRNSRLVVADVGAASGPEERWRSIPGLVHFLTFEPMPRSSGNTAQIAVTNFPVALSSRRGQGLLNIMRDPDASTLCSVNYAAIDPFEIRDGLEVTGTTKIELDTLDHCLHSKPGLSPDFLKVDVEGADLDVLRGATQALATSVLGIRIEVSFIERHSGAPFFGETDEFLRQHGFQLFQLSREQWIRRNQVFGYSSRPQLAWGDAVYFLSAERFLQRLSARPQQERAVLLTKMVSSLLIHGIHDYAWELVEAAERRQLITPEWAHEWRATISRSLDKSWSYLVKSFAGVLFASTIYLLAFPLKSTRQRATFYVQQRAGQFGRILVRMAGRSGPSQSCISD